MAKKGVSQGEMTGMIVLSVLIPAILLIGSLIYVAFYASGYSLFQKIIIVIIALIVICVAESLVWMIWASKNGFMQFPPKNNWKN